MKKTLFFLILTFASNAYGQSKLDSVFFLNINMGVNGSHFTKPEQKPYGIDISESQIKPGFYMSYGLEVLALKKISFHIDGYLRVFSAKTEKYKDEMKARYPEYDVLFFEKTNYSGNGISDGGNIGWTFSFSYSLIFKKLGLKPNISIGKQKDLIDGNSFAFRVPQTNYFRTFELKNVSSAEMYYSIGSDFFSTKNPNIGFMVKIGYGSNTNNYTITIIDESGNKFEDKVTSHQNQYFWNVGIYLKVDLLKKQDK